MLLSNMKNIFLYTLVLFCLCGFSQGGKNSIPPESILSKLQPGDSIIYYQCHVREHHKEYNLPGGEIATGGIEKYSVTEKFVLKQNAGVYLITKYISPIVPFPNRRFSGLKIREKGYWNFIREESFIINEQGLAFLLLLEKNGREAIEYDYAITKYTTNQLIIKHGKDFKQLVIESGELMNRVPVYEKL